MNKQLIFIIIGVVVVIGLAAAAYFWFGRNSKTINKATWKPLITEDSVLSTTLSKVSAQYKQPAMACVLVNSAGIVTSAAVGTGVYGQNLPVSTNSLFNIGSDTKSMTALLIQMLVDEGKLSYDMTLEQALPDIPMLPAYSNVTIRELLLDQAGIIAFQNTNLEDPSVVQTMWTDIPAQYPNATEQRRAIAKFALNLAPIAEPGTKAIYSNVGWSIAGLIAETAAGKPYEQLIREKIFEPLGMNDATIGGWPASPADPDQPRGHYPGAGPGKTPKPQDLNDVYVFPAWMNPSAGANCSIKDLAFYVQDNLAGLQGQGKLLDKNGYENIHSIHLTVPISEMYQGNKQKGDLNLGYAWAIISVGGDNVSAAEGTGGTFYAVIVVDPSLDAGFAGVTNSGDGLQALEVALKKMTGFDLGG
jgi:D-alanyl-D-alanine carboxypeptidase